MCSLFVSSLRHQYNYTIHAIAIKGGVLRVRAKVMPKSPSGAVEEEAGVEAEGGTQTAAVGAIAAFDNAGMALPRITELPRIAHIR